MKRIVMLLALLLAGCAAAPQKRAPKPAEHRPLAAFAVVCGDKDLKAIYIVFNEHVAARFTNDEATLMEFNGADEVDRVLPPISLAQVLELAATAQIGDILHMGIGCDVRKTNQ